MTSTKVHAFRQLFKGRQDVVPKFWQSKDGTKTGYTPMCRNEWREGVCQKPCRTCLNADYVPLSEDLLLDHFKGRHILGVYPLLKDATCHFIAADFDNHDGTRDPFKDAKAYVETCQVQELPAYILKSKSGKGYHVYLFFNAPVQAWKARLVAFALLKEAQVIGENVRLSSFDRLFPNQDVLSGKGFGNLIALPYQGEAVKKGNTLFLDPLSGWTTPMPGNLWDVLRSIDPIFEPQLDNLIVQWGLKRETTPNCSHHQPLNAKAETACKKLMDCAFIQWCANKPQEISEPLWFALISNLVCLRPGGYSLTHQFSQGHATYSRAETDSKIMQALDGPGPHRCAYIRKNGGPCENCQFDITSPICLLHQQNNKTGEQNEPKKRASISFIGREAGDPKMAASFGSQYD
jgi:hypothetical protein